MERLPLPETILQALATHRPLFHSEADFQHAFAWDLQRIAPSARVRLEVPISAMKGRGAVDILVQDGNLRIAFELKYLKRTLNYDHKDETFRFGASAPNDLARYDICKDVLRLEHLIGSGQIDAGYAIALTNDPNLWREEINFGSIDVDFQLSEGRVLSGSLAWAAHAGPGTKEGREPALCLSGSYSVRWQEFSRLDTKNGEFRALVIPVTRGVPVPASGAPPSNRKNGGQTLRSQSRNAVREFFRVLVKDEIIISFVDIEQIYGPLPPSAFVHNAWWHHVTSHPHAVWELEGFFATPDLGSQQVLFRRR